MKIKGLLFAAAGALTVSGAQAADLPGAPHPVDYVRICDTYGSGFYYIPGTDTCIRIFGRIRADYRLRYVESGDGTNWGDTTATDGTNFRARGHVRVDTRTETEAGLLRTFVDLQSTADTGGNPGLGMDSAFIQYGNWTFGRTGSISSAGFGSTYQHWFGPIVLPYSRTNVLAYRMDLGDGMSANVALEDSTGGKRSGNWIGQHRVPELHANIRASQDWGTLHIGAAVRQNAAYTADADGTASTAATGFTANHSVDYAVGWGINAGISADLGGASVFLIGGYADGFGIIVNTGNDFSVDSATETLTNTKAWGVAAGANTDLGDGLSAGVELYYGETDSAGTVADLVGVNANLVWRPVSGLQFGTEVNYRNSGDNNQVYLLFRAQRDY